MGKNRETSKHIKEEQTKFVGQPIFKQVISLIDNIALKGLIRKHNADHYYKSFKAKTHLITMLFGIFSRCDSMTEIFEGLRALGGMLNHLCLEKEPAKSPQVMDFAIGIAVFLKRYILLW